MQARTIVGVVALAGMLNCGLLSALLLIEIVDKVNDKLLERDQLDAFGWWDFLKTQRLHREYERLYPHGPLVSKARVLWALGTAFLLIAAWCFGFFANF